MRPPTAPIPRSGCLGNEVALTSRPLLRGSGRARKQRMSPCASAAARLSRSGSESSRHLRRGLRGSRMPRIVSDSISIRRTGAATMRVTRGAGAGRARRTRRWPKGSNSAVAVRRSDQDALGRHGGQLPKRRSWRCRNALLSPARCASGRGRAGMCRMHFARSLGTQSEIPVLATLNLEAGRRRAG